MEADILILRTKRIEFIAFETGIELKVYPSKEVIENHSQIATEVLAKIKPIPLFSVYLKFGAYPYFKENKSAYEQKLENTINLVIEIDVYAVYNISYDLIIKLKRLLMAIANSAPFTPNITKLSERIGTTRIVLIAALQQLEKAGLINGLFSATKTQLQIRDVKSAYLAKDNIESGAGHIISVWLFALMY